MNTETLPAASPEQMSMSVLMTPDTANFSGKVHGGTILKLLDQVAYTCASRYSGSYVVTLSVDRVVFRQPIFVGEFVTFMASVNHTGRSSMEIGIRAQAENVRTGTHRHAVSCFFTIVAVDDLQRPCAVKPWVPVSEEQKRRHAAALARRQAAAQ
jgi:acyl-CoA hydrolase